MELNPYKAPQEAFVAKPTDNRNGPTVLDGIVFGMLAATTVLLLAIIGLVLYAIVDFW
jgi:hypothetical protein